MEELEKAVAAAAVVYSYLDKHRSEYGVGIYGDAYGIWNALEKRLCQVEDAAKTQTKGDDPE